MKAKYIIVAVVVIVVCLGLGYMFLSQDTKQRIARTGVSYLDGDYNVTYTDDGIIRTWQVRDGKVTSEPDKGYYFFWIKDDRGKKIYIQTPINRTFIEGIND